MGRGAGVLRSRRRVDQYTGVFRRHCDFGSLFVDRGDPNCPQCLHRMTVVGPLHRLYWRCGNCVAVRVS